MWDQRAEVGTRLLPAEAAAVTLQLRLQLQHPINKPVKILKGDCAGY
jgi:hypothetical protein